MKLLLQYIFLVFFGYNAIAQKPVAVHLSEKDGLPDIEFYNMLEDSKGFIWLAANKGLYRYDGKIFKNFTHPQKRGLSVFNPYEDKEGRVWCSNISGQFFYVENDELKLFIDLKKEVINELADFYIRGNFLFVFTIREIYKVDLKTKEVIQLSGIKKPISEPLEQENQTIFLARDEIVVMDETEKLTTKIKHKDLIPTFGKSKIVECNGHTFFIKRTLNKSSIFELDIQDGKAYEIELSKQLEESHIIDIKGIANHFWISTSKGLNVYAYKNKNFIPVKRYFEEEYVTKILIDKNKNYWIGTLQNGIYVIPNIHIYKTTIPIENKNISALTRVGKDSVLIGTTAGDLGLYNNKTKQYTAIPYKAKGHIKKFLYNPIKKNVFISSNNQSNLLDLKTLKLTNKKQLLDAKDLSLIDSTSFLYAGYNGIQVININEKQINITKVLKNKRSYVCHYSKNKKETYVGYVDEFVKYDSIGVAHTIKYQENEVFAIDIAETIDGAIWVATFSNGVLKIVDGKVVKVYNTQNGLISNQTQKLKACKNKLWVVTDKGIQLINDKNKTIQTLTKNDGVLSYTIADIVDFGDKVYFGSNKGLFCIETKNVFEHNKNKPEVYFTKIKIQEKDTVIQTQYALKYDQNAIEFTFNANGFKSSEFIEYLYRLKGFKDQWITIPVGNGYVKYNSLPTGNYSFQVKAKRKFTNQESAIREIHFTIASPFWKQWWFFILIALFIAIIIATYYRKKLKEKEKEKNAIVEKIQLDKELVFLKLENLRSQMNPHFIFNALNSIQEYIILNQKELASDYLGKFADLIRTYLEHSTKGKIPLQDEIDCIEMYLELEKNRFEDKFQYKIHLGEQLDTEAIVIPTMLLQPYVENALKHGLLHKKENRELKIKIQYTPDKEHIQCEIEDNGVGRVKAKEFRSKRTKKHQSFALKATQNRLDLLNYGRERKVGVEIIDLYNDQNKPVGTKVIVTIPFVTI